MIGMGYVCIYSLIAFYVKGHHQWITYVCVTVIIAVLNINVKGYRSSFSVCPSLSMMKDATVNGKQLQELKSKPGVQIIFSYTDLAYPHIRSILAGSVKIISVKREKGLLWQYFWGRNTERLRSVFTPFFIQNVWFLNKHQRESNFAKATNPAGWCVDMGMVCD